MMATPIQLRMMRFMGHSHPRVCSTDEQRMELIDRAYRELIELTGVDLGYNLLKWHKYLLTSPDFSEEYGLLSDGLFAAIRKAHKDSKRLTLVAFLLAKKCGYE